MNDQLAKQETIGGAITAAQQAVLTQRTPAHVIKQRPGKGGKRFHYVEHSWVTEQLNLAFAWAWDWQVVEWRLLPEGDPQECMVLGRLTIHANTGTITKEQFGSSDIKRDKQGKALAIADDLKAASSDALKKCASLLGLALDLYSEDVTRYDPEPEHATTMSLPCAECDGIIEGWGKRDAGWMVAYTVQEYGRPLCRTHAAEAKQARNGGGA